MPATHACFPGTPPPVQETVHCSLTQAADQGHQDPRQRPQTSLCTGRRDSTEAKRESTFLRPISRKWEKAAGAPGQVPCTPRLPPTRPSRWPYHPGPSQTTVRFWTHGSPGVHDEEESYACVAKMSPTPTSALLSLAPSHRPACCLLGQGTASRSWATQHRSSSLQPQPGVLALRQGCGLWGRGHRKGGEWERPRSRADSIHCPGQ